MENSSFFLLRISRSHLKLPTPGLETSSFNPPPKLAVSIFPLVEFPEKDLASSSRVSQPSHSPLPTPNNPYPHPSTRNLDPPLPITNPRKRQHPQHPQPKRSISRPPHHHLTRINLFPQISKPDQRRFSSWGENGGGDGCCTWWMVGGRVWMGVLMLDRERVEVTEWSKSLITPFSLLTVSTP